MKSIIKAILLASLYISSIPHLSLATDWSYSGKTGPDNWSNLDKKFSACALGQNQSPVNIQKAVKAENNPIEFDYNHSSHSLAFVDTTMALIFRSGGFKLADHEYKLTKLNFHSPSEHHIDGKTFPLEAHFTHRDQNGNIAIIAVLFRLGAENKTLKTLLDSIPEKIYTFYFLPMSKLVAKNLLPKKKEYYRINGSLSSPPCTEGVLWLVMQRKVTVSAAQIENLKVILSAPNNRKLKPINSRQIIR